MFRFPRLLRAAEDGGAGGQPVTPSTTAAPAAAPATTADTAPAAAAPASGGDTPADPTPPATEGDPAKDGKTEGGTEAPAITPESYGDFDTAGLPVDQAQAAAFKALAAEAGLSKEAAQKLVTFRAEQIKAETAAREAMAAEWVNTAKTDKEYGGANFTKSLAIADRGLAQFGTPELRTLLEQTGLGNHPEIVRAFYRAGLTVVEPGPVNTTSPAVGSSDHVDILYPNSK